MEGLEKVELAAGIISKMHRMFGDTNSVAADKTVAGARRALLGLKEEYRVKAMVNDTPTECVTAEGVFLIAFKAAGIDIHDLRDQETVMAAVHRGIDNHSDKGQR